MSFNKDLSRFNRKITGNSPKFVRSVTMQAYKMLTQETPVDTGRAKGNWYINPTNPDLTTNDDTTHSGKGQPASPIRIMAEVAKVTGKEDKIFITNNLPYIGKLERGSSQQSPAGMLQVTSDKLKNYIRTTNMELT